MDCMQQMGDQVEEQMTQVQSIQVQQRSQLSHILADPEGVEEDCKDEDDGELSMPVKHNTTAHKLLMWPSIRALLSPKEYNEDYVMSLEEGHSLIQVYE